EERFAALLESAPDSVVIFDATGRIVLVNERTEELFGYSRDELLGETVELLIPQGLQPIGSDLDLAGRRKDGTEFPVDVSVRSTDTGEGQLVTAFIRDISERKAAEEMRRRSEELQRIVADRRALLDQ